MTLDNSEVELPENFVYNHREFLNLFQFLLRLQHCCADCPEQQDPTTY